MALSWPLWRPGRAFNAMGRVLQWVRQPENALFCVLIAAFDSHLGV